MHAYTAEIIAKARFHERANALIEWLSGRREHIVDDRRSNRGSHARGLCLHDIVRLILGYRSHRVHFLVVLKIGGYIHFQVFHWHGVCFRIILRRCFRGWICLWLLIILALQAMYALALHHVLFLRTGHAHHAVSHGVSLAFVMIVGGTDGEFRLDVEFAAQSAIRATAAAPANALQAKHGLVAQLLA